MFDDLKERLSRDLNSLSSKAKRNITVGFIVARIGGQASQNQSQAFDGNNGKRCRSAASSR